MSFAYPGIGRQLYLATYASGQPSQVTFPLDPDLEDEDLSDSEPLNDAFSTQITINYNVVPTQTTTIEYASDPTFGSLIILDTIPASATDLTAVWTTNDRLPGFVRIHNTSDVLINSVFINKQVASFG